MSASKPKFVAFHKIDLRTGIAAHQDITQKGDAKTYCADVVNASVEEQTNRIFRFQRETTEVCQALRQMLTAENCHTYAETVARRLLQTEKTAQAKYEHLTNIQKGNLLQVIFSYGNAPAALLAKVDVNSFLDETDLVKHSGLPFEKRVLKTCLIRFSPTHEVIRVSVSDTNSQLAEYWWKDFLELEEQSTDQSNTNRAFNAVDRLLANRLKRDHPSDYTFLRNNVISYFRTRPNFRFDDFQAHVFGGYTPDSKQLDLNGLKVEFSTLPEKHNFDRAFKVIEGEIKARFRHTIALTDQISLQLKDNIENLGHVIKAKKLPTEGKGVFIRSEEGYNTFHRPS